MSRDSAPHAVAAGRTEGLGAAEAYQLRTRIREVLDGRRILPSLKEMGVPPEILEAAEEITDASDVPGIERSRLEFLIRFLLELDRQSRLGVERQDEATLQIG